MYLLQVIRHDMWSPLRQDGLVEVQNLIILPLYNWWDPLEADLSGMPISKNNIGW